MDSIEDRENTYAVVIFLPRKNDAKNSVDLVPVNWLTIENNDKQLCQYPSPDDYPILDQYVRDLREPEENWWKYPVEIMAYAENYNQGKRRLKRAYKTLDIKSTDDEFNQKIVEPSTLSRKGVNKELVKVSSMHGSESSTYSTDEKQPKNKNKQTNQELLPVGRSRSNSKEKEEEAPEVSDLDLLKEFINLKLKQQEETLQRALVSVRQGIQYDLKKHMDSIKDTLVANKIATNPSENIASAIEILGQEIPIMSLEDFQTFDTSLKEAPKYNALLSFFRVKTFGENSAKGCISKMASALLTKNIEMYYSGTGKKIKGVGKLNFSATFTYRCMEDVVKEKFGDTEECKNFAGKVGRWLSGCGDRDHGRKNRSSSI